MSTLVIGCGNDLRGDDALGPRVAQVVAAWAAPGVRGLAVHQLTPELAELVASARRVIFVDACVPHPARRREPHGEVAGAVEIQPLAASADCSAIGHTGSPGALLALAAALYGRCPPAWLVAIPAHDFSYGAGLSPAAERGLAAALQQISALLDYGMRHHY